MLEDSGYQVPHFRSPYFSSFLSTNLPTTSRFSRDLRGNGWGHSDPPGVVRIGCLGDVSWRVVQRIAEATKAVVEPVCREPDKHSPAKEVELLIEPEGDENSSDYLPL